MGKGKKSEHQKILDSRHVDEDGEPLRQSLNQSYDAAKKYKVNKEL